MTLFTLNPSNKYLDINDLEYYSHSPMKDPANSAKDII